ncbi:hypothetical protein ES705_35861 [subsurface metagenome]
MRGRWSKDLLLLYRGQSPRCVILWLAKQISALYICIISAITEPTIINAINMPIIALCHRPLLFFFFFTTLFFFTIFSFLFLGMLIPNPTNNRIGLIPFKNIVQEKERSGVLKIRKKKEKNIPAYSNRIAGIQLLYFLPFASVNSVQFITPPVTSLLFAWIICGYEPVLMV